MPSRIVFAIVAALSFAASLVPTEAHRLKVFATVIGGSIEGRAYFVGGGPAENVSATLRAAKDNTVLVDGQTDSEGRFALHATLKEDLFVVVDAKDGHVARFAIAAARLPDTLPGGSVGAADEEGQTDVSAAPLASEESGSSSPQAPAMYSGAVSAAVARQIEPLAEQIDSLESSIRLHDVIGGVGYIVGIFGLLAFLRARRADADGGRR